MTASVTAAVARVTVRGLAPLLLALALAALQVLVRGVGLLLFAAVAGYRLADVLLARAGEAAPRPHWNPRTPRPVPAPAEVTR